MNQTSQTDSAASWLQQLRNMTRDTVRAVDRSLVLAEHVVRRVGELVRSAKQDGLMVRDEAVALWDAVVRASDEAQANVKATPRVARVVSEVARVAAAYRLFHVTAAWRDEASRQEALDALHAREAGRVTAMCQELGGGVLKVGQFLSCRADLLPAAWIAALSQLQDAVPPEDPEAIAALVTAELGALPSNFSVQPIAAASLAQVHVAEMGEGADARAVAVKVQRPGIAEVIAMDRRALQVVALTLGGIVPSDARALTAEIGSSLQRELDYHAEAAYARRFREVLAPLGVRVPEIHRVTDRVIVMELLRGERLVTYLGQAPPELRDRVLTDLARATAVAILRHGLVHADPHPGNFLVLADGPTLALLDFGAVTELSDLERRAYVALLPALFGRQDVRAQELLAELGFVAADPNAPVQYARDLIGRILASDDLNGIDPRVELERGLAMARANPDLIVPPHFVQLARSLSGLAGLFLSYRPKLSLGRIIMEVLAGAG